jgi:hypothetical protein
MLAIAPSMHHRSYCAFRQLSGLVLKRMRERDYAKLRDGGRQVRISFGSNIQIYTDKRPGTSRIPVMIGAIL